MAVKRFYYHLSRIMEMHDIDQLVDVPTGGENILDLILTNSPEAFSPCRVANISPLFDHSLVHATYAVPEYCQQPVERVKLYTDNEVPQIKYSVKIQKD